MSILINAVDALQCGLEDFETGTEPRLKSSIRNIHAGILLLFKEKLSRLSGADTDEALIKERVVPELVGSTIIWRGKGKKTVDVQSIQERFSSLGIGVNWKPFDSINSIRNEIEHYYTKATVKTIQEVIAKSFIIVKDFMSVHLGVDPKKHFTEEAWSTFIGAEEVYEREKVECAATYSELDCESSFIQSRIDETTCETCGSDLLRFDNDSNMECRACGSVVGREAAIVRIAEEPSGYTTYVSAKDGGEPEVVACPECNDKAFIVEEMVCACCGASQDSECERCGNKIPIEELDGSGLCGWCSHMSSKDD